MKRATPLFAAPLVVLFAASLQAQVQTGSLLVKAADERGEPVPGVTVTISSPVLVAGRMSAVTDAGGTYRFPSLSPGVYAVKLELPGFQSLVRESLVVNVGLTTPIDLTLKVAGREESLTVTGESPVIDTTNANINVILSESLLQKTPGGRDIWSLVEYKVPGLITNRPDVGGAAGGLQASFSARGTPNGQNVQFLNGINVGDPAAIGFTQFYYDYEAFDQIQVSTGAHDLSVPSSGVFLNMVTKTGGDRLAGKASVLWQGHQTQSANVGRELQRSGFRKDAGAVDYISDAAFQIGGPLVRDKLRFFTSFRDWRVHVNVPGFPEIEETNITSGIVNLTWQANDRNKVTAFASRQYYKKPNRGASALFTPESVFKEDDVTAIYQALWNSILGKNAFMDARVSYNHLQFPLYQKGHEQSLLDRSTGQVTRAAQTESIFGRRRLQASANVQYYVDHALGGRHELRFGIDHAHAPTTTTNNRIDDLNLFWRSAGGPYTVDFFNSPVHSKATVDVSALFLQDSYSVNRLTLTGGLRLERVEGYLPAQDSPSSRWFPNAARSFGAIHDIPNWKTVAPRLSVAYDLHGDGRTALKAAAGRYYYTISTGTPNGVNPNFTFSETYTWNDLNGDLKFQGGERGGLLSRAGGLLTSFDPDLRRPYTDELSASVDRAVMADLKLSVILTWRRERNNFASHDVGVPFSDFSQVTRADLGRDGLAGTADDTTIAVWNQDPATLGRNRFVIRNNAALDQTYRGLELTATKRFSNRWQMLAGYTWSRARIKAESVLTPNALINSEGPILFDRPHTFKVTGAWDLPYALALSANFRTQSGAPVTRTATFALSQGNAMVNVEPRGNERLDRLTTLDARLAKTFKVAGRDLEAQVDGYNLLNAHTPWDVRTNTGRIAVREAGDPGGALIDQPQYGLPIQILSPRIVRFGLSYRF